MQDFFDMIVHCLSASVSFLLSLALPGMDGVTFGHFCVAVIIIGIIVAALISQLRTFNLRNEAGMANYHDRLRKAGDDD